MRRFAFVLTFVAACAGAGVVPREEPDSSPGQYEDQLGWSYDKGIASAEGARHPEPIDVPLPSARQLAATKTGIFDKPEQLTKVVRFCVDVAGKTTAVEMVEPSADAKLNEILVGTVQRWSFKPAELGGQKVVACSTATFVMSFM